MRRALPWIALLAGLFVAFTAATGGYFMADHAWNEIVDYESPYVDQGLPPAAAGPALSGRVVLVIVDGMRDAISREMSALENLRGYGSSLIVEAPQPSLSYPTWTTLLSGAPHTISGVTTNWYEGRVRVETLLDTALAARKKVVVVGPESFEELYGADRADGVYLEEWEEGEYLSGRLVEETLRLVEEVDPSLVILHLPDLDEAGHDSGAASAHYVKIAQRIDSDLAHLVDTLEDGDTTFVVCADHGHLDSGGHGGWETEVTHVPAVFAGGAAALSVGDADQADIAPTVAALAGIPIPRDGTGRVIASVLGTVAPDILSSARSQRITAITSFVRVVSSEEPSLMTLATATDDDLDRLVDDTVAARLTDGRRSRLPLAGAVFGVTLLVLLVIGLASWRALLATAIGAVFYHLAYNLAFFVAHGHAWSLSAFNDEDLIQAFFNTRMAEAVAATLVAALAAGLIYPLLRKDPKGAKGPYLAGWLSLGIATVLVVQATLGWQVAWYIWWWGADVTWILPDLFWGFKFDLDLIQVTALGAAALLAPVVTFLVGRYHPRMHTSSGE